MTPREHITQFAEKVAELGVEYTVSHSSTSFCNSSYLQIGPFKVRCSNHDCGVSRGMTELHLFSLTEQSVYEKIERHFFPDRYEEVEVEELRGRFEIGADKINDTVSVINPAYRISAAGRVMALVSRKHIITVYRKKK